MPSVGKLEVYSPPSGKNIRVDDGFTEGMQVPIHYDPMLSKLIVYGKTRNEAMQLMLEAISDYTIEGVSTTLPFGKYVFNHETFRSGNFDTNFVKHHYSEEKIQANNEEEAKIAALIALNHYLKDSGILRLPK
jgi:propionyl-CoA carboxylase alpha chain